MHSSDPHPEPRLPFAVGDQLALRRSDRWEPVRVAALTEPGRARVTFEGYLTSWYSGSSIGEDVSTTELRSRDGLALHWQYKIVLRWTAILFVVAIGVMAGAGLYLRQEGRARDSAAATSGDWADGDAVSILWDGQWYPGTIISRQAGGGYLVSYDGYDDASNEVVDPSRLRAPATHR